MAPKGGIEMPDLPEGVTLPGAAPRDPVTPPEEEVTAIAGQELDPVTSRVATAEDLERQPFDISMPVEEKPLQGGSDPVDSHPVAAAEDAKALPGKKSSRKG